MLNLLGRETISKIGAHCKIRSYLTEDNNEANKIMKLNQNPPRNRNNSENNCNAYVFDIKFKCKFVGRKYIVVNSLPYHFLIFVH